MQDPTDAQPAVPGSEPLPVVTVAQVRFDAAGLIPAIVIDHQDREVLMLAWMNAESLEATLETQQTVFFSRSRQALWHKGATSGNVQHVRQLWVDCDADTLLVEVEQAGDGVACHTGQRSCFHRPLAANPVHEHAP